VWLLPTGYVRSDPSCAKLGRAHALVVGKQPVRFFTTEPDNARALVEWIESRARDQRVIVDFSDNLDAAAEICSVPLLSEFQRRCLSACEATVPTHALGERLLPYARHGITVIEDPYEATVAGTPRLAFGETLNLAWFGVFGPQNCAFLEREFAKIGSTLAPRRIDLTLVTDADQTRLVEGMRRALHEMAPNLALRHVAWSLAAVTQALERTDLVVLPQEAHSAWGRGKSHNRLVETIRAGRFAVASAIPAYLELASYAWIGNDLPSGIRWALENTAEALHRIALGQEYVMQRFSPQRIGDQWARLLRV